MEERRKSKDKKIDRRGRLLVNCIEKRGWEIFIVTVID